MMVFFNKKKELDYTEKLSGLSVESFLILPVQRIPRYVLLLQDLLKYTNATHQDFNNLSYPSLSSFSFLLFFFFNFYLLIITHLFNNSHNLQYFDKSLPLFPIIFIQKTNNNNKKE